MKLLLDTHIFLWYISNDPQLPTNYRDAILEPANNVYLSVASVWEAVVKHAIGKLQMPSPPAVFVPKQRAAHRITSLPIEEQIMMHLSSLPPLHRDPFDRILISQALYHGLTLLSVDAMVRAYPVPIL